MTAKFDHIRIGMLLPALLAISAIMPCSALAQAPPFLLQWGTLGAGAGQMDRPYSVAVDASGNVYVGELANGRIQKFTANGAYITQWPTGGTFPVGVAVDLAGNVYVAGIYSIKKFTDNGALVAVWTAGIAQNGAWAVAVDAGGNVYATDNDFNRVQKFSGDGTLITQWGGFGSGDGQFSYPMGVAVDPSGFVYVVDRDHDRIQKFTSSGGFVANWGTLGPGSGQIGGPWALAADGTGRVYVTEDETISQIRVFSSDGNPLAAWGGQGSGTGQFDSPQGVAVDANGNVYVADTNNNRIQKFGPLPTPTKATSWGRLKALYR